MPWDDATSVTPLDKKPWLAIRTRIFSSRPERAVRMVLNNDPRRVLDLLSKPVHADEDEFLDRLDQKETFGQMPGPARPGAASLDHLQGITNTEQLAMLMTETDYEETKQSLPKAIQTELTEKERRFFALLQQGTKYDDLQAAVPDSLDLAAVQRVVKAKDLPAVHVTPEEKEEKLEDMARRAAYLAMAAKTEEEGSKYQEYHDKFVAFYKKSN